jgi:hypothetical protein
MRLFALCAFVLVGATVGWGKEPPVSGPQPGQRVGPYSFLVASGPERGQQTCYVCETAEKPGAILFARSLSGPLAKLAADLDEFVAGRPAGSARAWVTLLGEKSASLDDLAKWSKQHGLKATPVGVFDDPVGPPTYMLSAEADLTAILFVNRKVVANFSFRPGELDDEARKRFRAALKQLGDKK